MSKNKGVAKKNSLLIKRGLELPFFCLAPMANITTLPFASQCKEYGADVVWTPMVHTDTIIHNWQEAEKILNFEKIKSFIIQIVGSDPQKISKAIKKIEKEKITPLYFDINAGCPDKNILKSGCGGAILKNHKALLEIIKSAQGSTKIPISVKTRAGFEDHNEIFNLVPKLLNSGVKMVTIHSRTVKQGYRGVADWNVIKKINDLFFLKNPTLLIGSGDVKSWQQAIEVQKHSGCDGVMIGRGSLGKPWIFKEIKTKRDYEPSLSEIKHLALELSIKANSIWGDRGIIEARKHYSWYFRGFSGARETRTALMTASTLDKVRKILS